MRYKRNEPFRYKFTTPIYCSIASNKKKYDGQILDLSPNGLKIESSTDLPLLTNIHITFGLNGTQIKVSGTVRWKKGNLQSCVVGMQLQNNPSLNELIINELKKYVKRFRNSLFMMSR